MAGDSSLNFPLLYRTCKLVVLLCVLHISVTVFFYVRTLDVPFAFVQNQQSRDSATQTDRVRTGTGTGILHPGPASKQQAGAMKEGIGELLPQDEPQPPGPEPGEKKAEEPGKKAEDPGKKAEEDPGKKAEEEAGKKAEDPGKKAEEEPEKKLEKCPETSPLLVGPLRVEFSTPVSLDQVRRDNPEVAPGGRFRPRDCVALQKVALIIPFRNRDEHLKFWLHYLHPVLQRQQLDYGVYVINQDGDQVFNRAKLLNVGYAEALKDYDYDCFVFSDVDLIPMDDRNTYRCFSQPRHLSVSMDKFGFRLPYHQYFGGVSSMSKDQYLKINGFPNNYWGWGGEDDDIFNRLSSRGMSISRPSGDVGKCRMIRHERDKKNEPNPQRFDRIAHTRDTMTRDGINSLSYRVVNTERLDLFTRITVDVGKPPG